MTTVQTAPHAPTKFDNNGQYSRTGILRYEMIFGPGYVSTGGHATTEDLCHRLGERAPGRGLGFSMSAAESAVPRFTWLGPMEPRSPASTWPRKWWPSRSSGRPKSEDDRFGDVSSLRTLWKRHFAEPFDIVWSRDAFMHIPDKPQVVFAAP